MAHCLKSHSAPGLIILDCFKYCAVGNCATSIILEIFRWQESKVNTMRHYTNNKTHKILNQRLIWHFVSWGKIKTTKSSRCPRAKHFPLCSHCCLVFYSFSVFVLQGEAGYKEWRDLTFSLNGSRVICTVARQGNITYRKYISCYETRAFRLINTYTFMPVSLISQSKTKNQQGVLTQKD